MHDYYQFPSDNRWKLLEKTSRSPSMYSIHACDHKIIQSMKPSRASQKVLVSLQRDIAWQLYMHCLLVRCRDRNEMMRRENIGGRKIKRITIEGTETSKNRTFRKGKFESRSFFAIKKRSKSCFAGSYWNAMNFFYTLLSLLKRSSFPVLSQKNTDKKILLWF